MRRRRSTTAALVVEIIRRGAESDAATTALRDSGEDLIHCRGERELGQFGGEVLLQRLACSVGSALKARVDFVRNISNQNVRHACILLSTKTRCNRPRPHVSGIAALQVLRLNEFEYGNISFGQFLAR